MHSSKPASRETRERLCLFRFQGVSLDESSLELRIGDRPVEIERKPLLVLRELLCHPGEVLTPDDLIEAVWAPYNPRPQALTNAVSKLRKALGDDESRLIETLPGVGYRLNAEVERTPIPRLRRRALNLQPGQSVPGRSSWILERPLGKPGTSEVWLACQQRSRQQRVFKFAVSESEVRALRREIMVQHVLLESLGPDVGVVRILDANLDELPVFLELEFAGTDLEAWAKADDRLAGMDRASRLELFLQIARVVSAAHGAGVLHKDLKPGNVLMGLGADATYPRLTDFGSASLLDPERLDALGITRLELTQAADLLDSPIAATLLYLAPEVLQGAMPTVRSDVYALGVMLYQIVVGDLGRPMAPGWEADIDDPLLREDLALAAHGDVAQRLGSVDALIDRIAHLAQRHEQLVEEARHEDERARLAERLARQRARQPMWMAVAATLVLGSGLSLWFGLSANRERRAAEAAHQRADATLQFLGEDVFGAANPLVTKLGPETPMGEVLKRAADMVGIRFEGDPTGSAAVHLTLGRLLQNVQEMAAAEVQFRAAMAALESAGAEDSTAYGDARIGLALALSLQSHPDQAGAEMKVAAAEVERLDDARLRLRFTRAAGAIAATEYRSADALAQYDAALKLLETPELNDPRAVAMVRLDRARALIGLERFVEAGQGVAPLLQELEADQDTPDLMLALARHVLGEALMYQDRLDEAEPLVAQSLQTYETLLGPASPRVVTVMGTRCDLLMRVPRKEEALACLSTLHDRVLQRLGPDHWMSWATLVNVGTADILVRRWDHASQTLTVAHRHLLQILGQGHPVEQAARYALARTLANTELPGKALPLLDGLSVDALSQAEPGAPWPLRIRIVRGIAESGLGSPRVALATLLPAVRELEKTETEDSESVLVDAHAALRALGAGATVSATAE